MDVVFSIEKVLLYWSVDHYNNVQKSERLPEKEWQVARWQYHVILIWRSNKLLLPHNLYSGANHIPLFYCSCWGPFYCDQTNTIIYILGFRCFSHAIEH